MKKLAICTILTIFLFLVLVSCTFQTPSQETSPSSPTATTEEPTSPATEGESILTSKLKVHFIDVGQGDAILVDLDNTEILIDGGGRSSGVVNYLNEYVDGTLEVMVATHPHAELSLLNSKYM